MGVDWRRSEHSTVTVPGLVRADEVMPGDTIRLGQEDVLVLTVRGYGQPGCVYLMTRTAGGAEVVHERRESERVHVVEVGAFDRNDS